MPGSEVITTEPLHRSLMWCATQMRAHTCTRAHTHADTPRSSQDKQPSHSGPCASVCSLKALTAKKEKTRPRLWCAPMFATCTLAGFDNTPLDLGKGHIFVLRSCNVWAWRIDVLCVHKDKKNYSLYWDEKCSDGRGCRHVVKTQSLNIIPVRSSATLSRPFRFWLEAWKQVAGTGKMFWT